jgi:hypothetical protein
MRRTIPPGNERHSPPAKDDPVTGWTAQAQLLADAIREPGFNAAALNAAAWSARTDPAATRGIVGAAWALTSGDAGTALWAAADPCPSDQALTAAAAELEGEVAQLLKVASQMARNCRAALEAACAAAASAQATLNSDAPPGAKVAAQEALSAARAAIGDCEAALEIIDETGTRLAHAGNCLARVPGDLAAVYEDPYQHIRDGGTLPHDGEFLTGGTVWEAA